MTPLVNLISWNIRGIGSPAKKTKILNNLLQLKSDICLLQETHLTEAGSRKLTARWIGQAYHCPYNLKQRGVSILINKNIPYTHSATVKDPEGRYIIINGNIGQDKITIANVYGSNTDSPEFFHTHSMFSELSNFPDFPLILGGDFNTVLDTKQDHSHHPPTQKPHNSSLTI